jgi:hypothetical protein
MQRVHFGGLPYLLAASVAFIAPQTASASFAIFAPGAIRPDTTSEPAREVIARATAALGRPPGAMPRLHTEGTLPGHGIRDISLVAKRDQPIVLDLALAWTLTRDRRFLAQTERYLLAWADVYQMSFNPIDETGFDTLMMATDLTAGDLPAASRSKLATFWRRMAVGYLDAMDAGPKNAHTNWQSHRIKLATMAAYLTGDQKLIARARSAYDRQLAVNLRADGSTFDFEERDALHYVTYNFDPLLMVTLAAQAHGDDWFSRTAPTGASLPRSLDWFAAYARGEKTHIEFARSKIAFDRERAAAGQSEYAPHPWKPSAAVQTFALAALLAPTYASLAERLASGAGREPPAWIELYRATGRTSAR